MRLLHLAVGCALAVAPCALLECSSTPDPDGTEIGVAGGTVRIDGAELIVPPGALTKTTTLRIVPTTAPVPNGTLAFRFEPLGMHLEKPARVRLRFEGAGTLGWSADGTSASVVVLPSAIGGGWISGDVSDLGVGFVVQSLPSDGGQDADSSDADSGDAAPNDANEGGAADANEGGGPDATPDASDGSVADGNADGGDGGGCGMIATANVPQDIALDGQHVFWLEATGGVWQADKGTWSKTQIAPNTGERIATDGVRVYWTEPANNQIASVPVGGGAVQTVSSPTTPRALALDGAYVYWAGLDFYRAPVGSSVVQPLGAGIGGLELAVDGTYVYAFTTVAQNLPNNGVVAYPKNWSSTSPINLTCCKTWGNLALDSTHVYGIKYNISSNFLVQLSKPNAGATTNQLTFASADQSSPAFLAADDTSVVYRGLDGVVRNWVPGQSTTTLVACIGNAAPNRFVMDATRIYYTSSTGVGLAPR